MAPGERNDEPPASRPSEGAVSPELLDLLVCPLGKAPLRLEGDSLVCTRCGLVYRVTDGIPNMLIDEARLPEGVDDIQQLACYPGEGESE
jgi:uncharacterized protein YbaR (Trm112 family)